MSLCGSVSPVTVAERCKACTLFARSEAGILGSNSTQGMDVWCVCLCCPVFRYGPCDELITRPRSPAVCKMIMKLKIRGQGQCRASEEKWLRFGLNFFPGCALFSLCVQTLGIHVDFMILQFSVEPCLFLTFFLSALLSS
jgi:hypothetical protein